MKSKRLDRLSTAGKNAKRISDSLRREFEEELNKNNIDNQNNRTAKNLKEESIPKTKERINELFRMRNTKNAELRGYRAELGFRDK